MKKFLIISAVLLFIFGAAFILSQALAENGNGGGEEECIPGPIEKISTNVSGTFRCDDFTVYKCVNNACGKAGGAMEQGVEWYICETTTEKLTDGCDIWSESYTEHISGPHGPDQIAPFGQASDYQICPASYNEWGTSPPILECSGSCYPPPDLKPLDDPDLLPKNVLDGLRYKLPLNFGWEDNVEQGVAEAPNFCAVGSYEFNIVNPPLSEIVTGAQLQKIEDPAYRLECQLKSNNAYQWKVRACLDSGGTDCGEWSENQNFSTSLAPEPVSPYDPDWTEEGGAEDVGIPVTLKWCEVGLEEAGVDELYKMAYAIQVYTEEDGKQTCHPRLIVDGECQPIWLSAREAEGKIKWELPSEFQDEKEGYFTKDTIYKWVVGTYVRDMGTAFGQMWKFVTSGILSEFKLIYPLHDPAGEKPVELPLRLRWRGEFGASSFVYEIRTLDGKLVTGFPKTVLPSEDSVNYPQLSLNTPYKWQVWQCWDYAGEKCEEEHSEERQFTTTGRPPRLDQPSASAEAVPIPVNFQWEAVPGAKSYILKVWGDGLNFEEPVDKSEFSLDYPEHNIRQETNYSWQAKTCAWQDGQTCGTFSPAQNFKTFRLPAPKSPSPADKDQLSTDEKYISWQKVEGAKAYQYKIKYLTLAAAEEHEGCKALVGQEVVPTKTVPANSDYVQLNCLGRYEWQAVSCLDKNCDQTSHWSGPWTFDLAEPIEIGKGGLVPCGRAVNNPATPWNEREPCQIKHLFLLVKVLIDFLLLRVAPLALVVLLLYSGAMFYFSLGKPAALARVISLWKSVGIGLALAFFAWMIVNVILGLVGYPIGVFGNWYQL